ncbi:MAG: ABC transporter permease [Lachnospiraceae bacterium]|nr:ABC transporter permease [Lachnospiraceae bacterium]
MKKVKMGWSGISQYSGLVIILVIICIIFQAKNPLFLTFDNVIAILRQLSIYGIVGIGMGFLILNGYLDLTVGSMIGICGVTVAYLMTVANLPIWLSVLLTLAAGGAIGAFNGAVITYTGIPAFIFTLAMTTVYRGIIYLVTDGKTISNLPKAFLAIGRNNIMGIPIAIIIFFATLIIAWVILNRTTFGRSVYVAGGNPLAAKYSGINNRKITILCYMICGVTAAMAGTVLAAKLSAVQPTLGNSYEMEAISVAVIGGMSLTGGVGSIAGILLGALVLGVIDNGMIMIGLASYWQMVVKGIVIVIAVIFDIYKKKGALTIRKIRRK